MTFGGVWFAESTVGSRVGAQRFAVCGEDSHETSTLVLVFAAEPAHLSLSQGRNQGVFITS